jgi:hypothetical protein
MPFHYVTQPFVARAEQILEGFEYTLLAGSASTQVWDCRKPGSSQYAFTICVSPRGIAVVGDISPLTFSVGAAYGLRFLAGDDVTYFIHSKLSHGIRAAEIELDAGFFQQAIARLTAAFLARMVTEVEINADADAPEGGEPETELRLGDVVMPSWVIEPDGADAHFEDLRELASTQRQAVDQIELADIWERLSAYLNRCAAAASTAEANALLDEAGQLLKAQDAWDIDVCRASSSLMQDLFLVNLAAKRIVAIQAGQRQAGPTRSSLDATVGAGA